VTSPSLKIAHPALEKYMLSFVVFLSIYS